jgi:hypothetical protein
VDAEWLLQTWRRSVVENAKDKGRLAAAFDTQVALDYWQLAGAYLGANVVPRVVAHFQLPLALRVHVTAPDEASFALA